jgi:hypothetical protein
MTPALHELGLGPHWPAFAMAAAQARRRFRCDGCEAGLLSRPIRAGVHPRRRLGGGRHRPLGTLVLALAFPMASALAVSHSWRCGSSPTLALGSPSSTSPRSHQRRRGGLFSSLVDVFITDVILLGFTSNYYALARPAAAPRLARRVRPRCPAAAAPLARGAL